ncbi:phytanoyl-CoA dioxygenase family protein [Edaphobacter dinghuensis]|uniref:Phytanoyl-CoA dioxygenase PhyH n=1 Tax=Edaphobacter dinghuensis TaxID=1560005 RepID=A0A917HQE2_9BACT|nr:phytanoyl-CoA dioxygenase family protein [Edaphobacter dinghuensis]GGG85941.1 hypothetical protein GCM10011585_32300 [Edaphobacter dinghuensis]
MKPFREMKAHDLTSSTLQEEIDSRGYVLVRGLLPRDHVTQLLGKITQILSAAGWLLPGYDPLEHIADLSAACGDPNPTFKQTYQNIFNLELFHALPHHPVLQQVMKMLVGNQLLIHPKPIGRLIFPHCKHLTVHAHQDYRFMGGDTECFTVWIPLHDCPVDVGPLRVVEGSHHLGYMKHDDENLRIPEIPTNADLGGDWVGGQINAGDVLIFHSLTVHAASPNISNQLRISLDCRFQNYERILNPANLVFAGDSGKSWEKTYAGWSSDALKYYWRRLPLELHPSKVEIEQLSKMADSPAKQARYNRMLSQLN